MRRRMIKTAAALCLAMSGAPVMAQDGDQAAVEAEPEAPPPPQQKITVEELLEKFPAFGFDYLKTEPAKPFDTSKPVIGIGFAKDGAEMRVAQVMTGSAAEAAGMTTGTIIRRINGVKVDEFSLEELSKLLGAIDGEIDFEMSDGRHHRVVRAAILRQAESEE